MNMENNTNLSKLTIYQINDLPEVYQPMSVEEQMAHKGGFCPVAGMKWASRTLQMFGATMRLVDLVRRFNDEHSAGYPCYPPTAITEDVMKGIINNDRTQSLKLIERVCPNGGQERILEVRFNDPPGYGGY